MLTFTILLIGQQAAGLGKYGYGNGIAVTERISGTVLSFKDKNQEKSASYFIT